ncbi:hypothetical protein HK104_005885 [Borealophlyctis nickersoniae]|nr:hypothetical protein HK104_005885 [Borealophlyctis nickersoniae]
MPTAPLSPPRHLPGAAPSSPWPIPVATPDFFSLSFSPPTRPSCHPLILINPETATTTTTPASGLPTPPISPAAEAGVTADACVPEMKDEGVTGMVQIEPFIQNQRLGGLFVRKEDAEKLGLKCIGVAETCYGMVQRYSPVTAQVFFRRKLIENVYQLPAAFANTKYHDGVTGIDTLHSLGFSVLVDRGMVYLQDPELTQYQRVKA